jgi:hypothetical protein
MIGGWIGTAAPCWHIIGFMMLLRSAGAASLRGRCPPIAGGSRPAAVLRLAAGARGLSTDSLTPGESQLRAIL